MAKENDRYQAVCVMRSGDLLCRAFNLTIVNGRVIDSEELTRAEDMPAIAIGHAQRLLWKQYRHNRDVPKEAK